MIVAISKFEIQNGMEEEVREAFRNRPKLVDNAQGFIRMDVISPLGNPSEIHLITYWDSEEEYENWHKNHLKHSHKYIPKGLKVVPKSWELIKYEYICN
jgi:heme oxygenase (mycobilin-producing)